jgi:hypothetical protein
MKGNFLIKNLIIIIGLLQVIYSENEFIKIKAPFKPFVSVLSPESMAQFEDTSKYFQENKDNKLISLSEYESVSGDGNKSDAEIYFSQISFSVKCMFVENYNLYDISGLGKNVLSDEKEYNITINGKKIYFNFCYDLKPKADINCNFEKKQVFVLDENNKCDYLANSILSGNSWYTGTNEYNNITYLRIDLNHDNEGDHKNHVFTYILECDKSVKYNYVEGESYYKKDLGNGTFETKIYIKTSEACPKMDFYVIWEFINNYSYIFASLLVAFGIFNCIFGNKFADYTCFILTLFGCTIFVLFFAQFILPPGCAKWIIWVILVLGIIIGCSVGYVVFNHYEKVLAFLVGGIGGVILGQFLFSMFGNLIPWNSILVNVLFVIICVIVAILLAFWLNTAIVIGATSFIGSYAFIRGLSLFFGSFPSEFTIIDLKNRGETDQIAQLLTWKVYMYLAAIVICTGLSIFVQIVINKKYPKNNDKDGGDRLMSDSS